MGIITPPAKCFFTGLSTRNIPIDNHDRIDYEIDLNGKKIVFTVYDFSWETTKFVQDLNYVVKGLILNDKWPIDNRFVQQEDFENLINSFNYPKTPKEKFENLFLEIYKLQETDGQEFEYTSEIFKQDFWTRCFFKNKAEYHFYLESLNEKGLLDVTRHSEGHPFSARTTFSGLNYQIELTESGQKSINCFVAMSFDEKNKGIRDAIKAGLNETGFVPILIDEQHFDAEKTINDEIIASIKKSKFCVADFTDQKDGVYFEAGFALGRGLKVIYTCHIDSFEKTHFDTKHFPHIIYKTASELKEQLKTKIEAWIKN